MLKKLALVLVMTSGFLQCAVADPISLGPRPFFLIDKMDDGALKTKLQSCAKGPFKRSDWSIGHRGAPLQFAEHTRESYTAALGMGAGIIECDVTFTKDRQLVCRHGQNDLHTTTDILLSGLAATCIKPFVPASAGDKATAECRTSEITLQEFKSLSGKMDAANKSATTVEDYVNGTVKWRTDLYATNGTLLSHQDYIALVDAMGGKFTPELKSPAVAMPFDDDYSQAIYAQQMIDEYKSAGIAPARVYPQSFNLDDIIYWIKNEPAFGKQAVYLDDSYSKSDWSQMDPSSWRHSMSELKEMGVNYIAPPMWVLVTTENGNITPSRYALEATAAGLKIITWTAERSGPLQGGGGWYYQSIKELINNDGDVFNLLHVLHRDVGIKGIFSDWPATTTYYANCFGLD